MADLMAGAPAAPILLDDDTLRFRCPRCATEVTQAFYGPCAVCRADLIATLAVAAKDIEVADYEPKMNVTPNAVASKD